MKQKILGFIAFAITLLFRLTWRYRLHFEDFKDVADFNDFYKRKKKNYLMAFYHREEVALVPYFSFRKIAVMVSRSKDGEILATILRLFGFKTIRGSSSRGAVAALIKAIRKAKEGYSIAVAVDGPRGPAYEVKEGIISMQEKSKVPILPLSSCARRYWQINSTWDKTKIPKPFTTIDVYIGKTGQYDRAQLEEKLKELDHYK